MKFPFVLALGACCALQFPLAVFAGLLTDPDPDWKEQEYALPVPPRDSALREIFVSTSTRARFLIDEDSIAVGDDGVVRYVLVALSSSGARNVTAEGIRCATWTWRMYATGRDGGGWSKARDAQWQAIVNTTYNRVRAALATDLFCDASVPPRNRGEVLERLRKVRDGALGGQ